MTDVIFRPLAEGEFELFDSYATPPVSGVGERHKPFLQMAQEGEYRHDWLWVALRGDELVARAAFWGPPGSEHAFSLDLLDFQSVEVGAELLKAAYAELVTPGYDTPSGARPDFHLFLPADWRERPDSLADANVRVEAAEKAGLEFHVERLNLRWDASHGLPERSTRLRFEPVTDDEALIEVLTEIVEGSLDAGDQVELLTHTPREVAADTLKVVAEMPGGRDRFRLGYNEAGDLVGAVLPTRNSRFATTGYIGVSPRHRGHGYAFDLLAESMHIFAAEGETVITDNTDVGNVPMAAIFDRIGYRITGRRMIFR
ncbi:GNAT family N-acetyltransferase [Nonomuraea sp. NBC_01738]|uniref:GNAT family N-acetyltransferase n=1 Tax=Nonomuraea sp. NBC_01738 TaxID=2976003 RepID=UPI002E156E7A|nr:GNAT family N-acetyltransferase [Nonomuraea sp. NBC_01738]